MKIQRTTYLSLGTNQGNTLSNLQKACDEIAQKVGRIVQISSVYKTASWGFKSDDFLNVCIEVSTNLTPEKLLKTVLEIETAMGRKRGVAEKYQARIIDIDVLLFDDEIIFYENLKVPHPSMLDRKFVMVPLTEIAPNMKHPIAKKTILICLQSCDDASDIEKTDLQLERPISLVDKYNYIAIEGNIGAGKTSLAKKIAQDFNAKLILERFADNAFLPKFYKEPERYAFTLEMSFLADRYQQISDDLSQLDLFKDFMVSDYDVNKSLIFSKVTLPEDEFRL